MTAQNSVPTNPFRDTAWLYHEADWHPIPMPKGSKWPPPDGFTGHYDLPSAADIQEWAEGTPYTAGKAKIRPYNIALRLGPNQLGIDVDMYEKRGERKQGRRSLAELEQAFGPLPRTLMTTARDDGSGIRHFRVPEGLQWPGAPKPGIEIVQMRHRYAMAPPSENPDADGARYRWVWSDGEEFMSAQPPNADEIAWLPDTWIQGLTGGALAVSIDRTDMDRAHGLEWLAQHGADQPLCPYMRKIMTQHVDAIVASRSGARHDAAVAATQAVVHLAAEGHAGLSEALSGLHAAFEYVTKGEDRPGEWERMVVGAIGVAAARNTRTLGDPCKDPYTGRDDVHTQRPGGMARVHVLPVRNNGSAPQVVQPHHDSGILDSRPELWHIQQLARTQMASPWSTLGVILARVVAAVPPFVVLPPIIGGYGSLNSFYALVGASGIGKGISEQTAELGFTILTPADEFNAGSGEGLGHLFMRRVKVPKEEGGGYALDQYRANILLNVNEVDSLTSLSGRQGATLLPQLRSAWSGEHLGFAYADPDKALKVPAHSYRLSMLVGVQPGRAAGILEDADGGTPQRFVWLSTLDPDIQDDMSDPPDPWQWQQPGPWKTNSRGRAVMDVPDHVRDEIRKARAAMLRDPGSFGLDTHHYYARLKVAGAFALLAKRGFVNSEDWELSGELMRISLAERAYVQACLNRERARIAELAGIAEGHRQVATQRVVEGEQLKRVCRTLVRKASRDEWRPTRHFNHSVNSRDRGIVQEALESLVSTGQFEAQMVGGNGGAGMVYRLAGAQ